MNNKCTVYIGNGFDVACGFRTKYSQFIESDIFINHTEESKLAKWILEKYNEDKDKWSDLEELLYLYSINMRKNILDNSLFQKETDIFRNNYRDLVLVLQKYIANQYSSSGNGFVPSLVRSWHSCFNIDAVCCFNYTPYVVLEKVLPDYVKLARIHGELMPQVMEDEVKVKLGIDRCMKVCKEHEFLYKDTMGRYGFGVWAQPDNKLVASAKMVQAQLRPMFYNSDFIIIYGCSLGRSDTAYYKYLFENTKSQTILLYHYGVSEKETVVKRIKELSPRFNVERDVIFIDSSFNNGYCEDLQGIIETHNMLNAKRKTWISHTNKECKSDYVSPPCHQNIKV